MGCKSSKLLTASVELGDKPRRSRANLKLDLIQYLPNEPLELPAPHHGDVIPDKKTAGGAAAAAAAAAARSPRSPTLTPAMTPHAEEELDPAVPATTAGVATLIVQQCSAASDDASEAGLLDSEAELPGTRTKVCSSRGDSASLSRRDSNEKVSTEGRGDHNSKRRRRESGSDGEGERADGGGDKKRASPAAGVEHGGDNTQNGDGATCITASAITLTIAAAVEAVSEASSSAQGRPSPSRSYSDTSSSSSDSSSSSSNSDSPATTTPPTPPTPTAAVVATFDPLPPITGELLLFLEKYRRPDSNRPADERRQEEEAGEKGGEGGMGVVVSSSRVHLPGGRTYEGQLRRFDGLPQGWGSVTLKGGDMYEGSWLGGRVHGKGALRLQNGNVYWGSWAYGRKHGLGTFAWSDGSRYDELALLLLSASLCLRASWGQDEDGDLVQSEEEFFEELYGNDANDSAVAGVIDRGMLYVAINTGNVDIGGDPFGGTDLVVKIFDEEDLEEGLSVQLGGDLDDMITAIAAHDVSSSISDILIVGSTTSEDEHLFESQVNGTGAMDWFIARLDRETLETKFSFVDGTEFEDQQATAVAITPDGDYVVAGWTAGDYFGDNVGANNADDDSDGSAIGFDLWVVKIDSDLTEFIWSEQMGTIAFDQPTALVVDENNVYVVGNIDDFGEVLTDAEEEEFASMFVYCLDGDDGSEIWFKSTELGFMSDEGKAYGAVLTSDGDELYVSGNTKGIIDGYDGKSTGSDELFIVSFDAADGDVNWVYQSEGNATAFGTGGIVLAEDGLTPIISGTAFGNHFNLSSSYWVGGSGDMIAAMIDTEELEVIKYYTATAVNNETRQNPLALVKVEDEEFGVYMMGTNDGEWLEDSEPLPEDTSYLILKVVLDTPPEVEEDGGDGRDFPYWYVGIPVFAIGGVLFLVAYKWAAYSQAAKAKLATQV